MARSNLYTEVFSEDLEIYVKLFIIEKIVRKQESEKDK
jgi:hypothetical protein